MLTTAERERAIEVARAKGYTEAVVDDMLSMWVVKREGTDARVYSGREDVGRVEHAMRRFIERAAPGSLAEHRTPRGDRAEGEHQLSESAVFDDPDGDNGFMEEVAVGLAALR